MPLYTFLSWARPDLKNLPVETLTSALPAAAKTQVELAVNDNAPIGGDLWLDGPGDVIGIDPRQIARMEPAPGTLNFESNYFPAVEFARPDFPWLFTPASANTQQQLRPWLVLAVVRKQPGVAFLRPERELARLEIKAPARPAVELPDLAQSWAWAHAQIEGPAADLATVVATDPQRAGSRLLCPRRLEENAGYFACLVPAFEVGRLAGLGLPTDEVTTLEPAWKTTVSAVVLPVYHMWEFATGAGGDFESLAQLLLEPKAGGGEGPRPRMVDAAEAGEGLPAARARAPAGETEFALECPLVPLGADRTWKGKFAEALGNALRTVLARAGKRGDPRVTAPLYAAAQAAQQKLPPGDGPPHWWRQLNLDPRFRLAASFGAEVIRRNQDRLVDAAWDHAGDIRAANALIRHAQVAAAAAAAIHRKDFSRLSDSALIEITRPLHARLAMADGKSFRVLLAQTNTPATLTAAEFRRAARPRGPVFRRTAAPTEARTARPFLRGLSTEVLTMTFVRQPPPIATPDAVEARFLADGNTRPGGTVPVSFQQVTSLPANIDAPHPGFAIAAPALPAPPGAPLGFGMAFFAMGTMSTADTEAATRFRAALRQHQPLVQQPMLFATGFHQIAFSLAEVRLSLNARLAPAALFTTAMHEMVTVANQPAAAETLNVVRTAPSFSEPLYAALGAMSPDLVVQGFETIGANTITPLETNARFVESFLAGANHEMARELFWREFPTPKNATFFQTFWDSQASATPTPPDIPPLTSWPPEKELGQNTTAAARAVFLIRGELIRRYPTASVYLRAAGAPTADGTPTMGERELQPVIRGTLANDAAFFGFDVQPEDVTALPGWLFVIEEPPAEPRFGVEVVDPPPAIQPEATAARTAHKFIQRPVRFAIHARDLLPSHG